MKITLPGKAATLMASQREQAEKQRARLGVEARSWYRITNAADPDEAEVLLYDEIGGWFGNTADDLIAELKGISSPRMRVRINSPGGSVFEGIAIANALRAHPASVTVQVDSVAASIASVIAMAGDRIEMAPNSMMMIHDATGMAWGNAREMEEMAELLDLISDNIADAYAARAGGTREQWRERMKAETWYLPEDAVDNGLADEAVPAPKQGKPAVPDEDDDEDDEPEMARAWDLAAYGYTGPRREQPKGEEPLDVTEHVASAPTLLITMGDLLSEETVAKLRALFTEATTPEPVTEPEPEASAAEPVDEWAASVASLLPDDDADDWSALVTNMTGPDTSSRAAAEA